MVKLFLKHGKDTLEMEAVNWCDLQNAIKSQTQIPIERQKLLAKGKQLKEADFTTLSNGAKLMLMGTPDEQIVKEPSKKIVFEEDLTEAERAKMYAERAAAEGVKYTAVVEAAGLENLGNTCYMNSVLQSLRAIPELKSALKEYAQKKMPTEITCQLYDIINKLDSTTKPVTPLAFTTLFRANFPMFAERTEHGNFQQQDADEALNELLVAMSNALKSEIVNIRSIACAGSSLQASNAIDAIFGGEMETKIENTETSEELPVVTTEGFRKLRCFISSKTNFLTEGLQEALTETIEKRSEKLGRSAVYKKNQAIVSLPSNLIVQFMRFFWKRDINKKSKILRKVDFPLKLDALPLCGDELKRSLTHARKIIKYQEDKKLGLRAKRMEAISDNSTVADNVNTIRPVDTSGFYELYACVTHQGRDAEGGHYIGWVKQSGDNWWKFDDAVVSQVTSDDIKALSGGGDWHMAYLLFYRRIDDLIGIEWQTTFPDLSVATETS